ncbi:hypothetical protein QE152_g27105 [Popillia japonica]|uniref:Reverse transcriptase n=1 Tax=Popillia japonica TaxID=7064 RepID=A0AAW1JWH2_POPJA
MLKQGGEAIIQGIWKLIAQILEENWNKTLKHVKLLEEKARQYGVVINEQKTKCMVMRDMNIDDTIVNVGANRKYKIEKGRADGGYID